MVAVGKRGFVIRNLGLIFDTRFRVESHMRLASGILILGKVRTAFGSLTFGTLNVDSLNSRVMGCGTLSLGIDGIDKLPSRDAIEARKGRAGVDLEKG